MGMDLEPSIHFIYHAMKFVTLLKYLCFIPHISLNFVFGEQFCTTVLLPVMNQNVVLHHTQNIKFVNLLNPKGQRSNNILSR